MIVSLFTMLFVWEIFAPLIRKPKKNVHKKYNFVIKYEKVKKKT